MRGSRKFCQRGHTQFLQVGSFVDFQGIRTSIAKKPCDIFFLFFFFFLGGGGGGWGGVWTSCSPSGSAHVIILITMQMLFPN